MDGRRFLVTGGAGYVGSHVVHALIAQGAQVVIIDDLRQGHRGAVPAGVELIQADIADARRLAEVFAAWRFDAVFHFAALSLVGESMREPLRYCAENLSNSLRVAEAAVKAGCLRFVLSSTAALFGFPKRIPIDEDAEVAPVSAYGESKLMVERGLAWADQVHGLRFASLRYFNAAGADPDGRIGEDHDPESHLIPLTIGAALGTRPPLTIYGTDYPTPDGTCIRDYIHVEDLAEVIALSVFAALPIDALGRPCNVATGVQTRIADLAQLYKKLLRERGRDCDIIYGPPLVGDVSVSAPATDRIKSIFPSASFRALHDGLPATLDWFLARFAMPA